MKRFSLHFVGLTGLMILALNPVLIFAEPVKVAPLVMGPKQKVLEGTLQLSPPALQFDPDGTLYLTWADKIGQTRSIRLIRVTDGGKAISAPVQVNPPSAEPGALHQAPGLATGQHGKVFVTWSAPKNVPDSPFATDLFLARSQDGGMHFDPPILVNDDGNPISHTFEHIRAGADETVYLAWLDNRGKDKSGAGTIFACSRDGGQTVEKNITIDAMACPCCRPMVAVAPDGNLWVAWRKVFEDNVRDIVIARSTDQGKSFSAPSLVNRDGWVFPACPHRGPSIGFDRFGRLYVAWYTEGTDEQPRLLIATSDDRGKTFSVPFSLHTSTTSLPDQLRMAVHPDGVVVAVWEEVTGVRKRVVMRLSMDRGQTFGPVQALSEGARAENPTVAVHDSGAVAVSWTEHAFPNNRIILQQGKPDFAQGTK